MTALTEDQIIHELNHCLTQLRNSPAQYILEANPYVSDDDDNTVKQLQAVAKEEEALAEEVTALIEKLEGIPQVGLTDPMLAELNYLSFPYLLDVVIREKEKEAKTVERLLEAVKERERTAPLVEKILETHRAHHAKLKDLREKKYSKSE